MSFTSNCMHLPCDTATLFIERFPRYALLLSTWCMEGRVSPVHLPAINENWPETLPCKNVEVIYIYGIGDGSAAKALFSYLKTHSLHRLIFLEPRVDQIVHFLQQPHAKEVLQNQQIEIFHLPRYQEKRLLIQELSKRYPLSGVFVEMNPQLSNPYRKSIVRLRFEILRETALSHALFVDRFMQHIPLSHLMKNVGHFSSAFYVNRMKDAFKDIPAIICGAGPSLQHSIDDLKQLKNRAIIFAGGSAIAALTSQNVMPHFAVAIDPNKEEIDRIKNSFAFEVPFIFSTRLHSDCFAALNGPYGYVRSGMSGICELWLEEKLHLQENILGEHLTKDSLSVTMLSAAIAFHLGCNPIMFDGIDLAYDDNRRYADGVTASETMNEEMHPIDRHVKKKDRNKKSIISAIRWVMESQALTKFAISHRERRLVNCTQGGLGWKRIERSSLKEMKQACNQMLDIQAMIHSASQRFLLPVTKEEAMAAMKELEKSLDAVLMHIDTMIKSPNLGLMALAEIEMKDELAYQILFYDIEETVRAMQPNQKVFDWQAFAILAKKCQNVLKARIAYERLSTIL